MGKKTPTILVTDDEPNICHILSAILRREGYEVITANDGHEALEMMKNTPVDVVIADLMMPNRNGMELLRAIRETQTPTPVIMITAYGTVKTAVEAMKLGAYDYIAKPFEADEIKIVVRRALEQRDLIDENIYLREELKIKYRLDNVVGDSRNMQEVYRLVQKVAKTRANVLIRGESGTGKELIARAIHYNSPRDDKPFIAVCCAALPADLLESELFGYEKGAFTGAQFRKPGRFELADGGTLFLDEIGELSLNLQVKLLRVLQEREFERVGGTKSVKVDVRLITASNKNLEEAIAKRTFREDLYYRLQVVQIFLPPLRERKEDIPLLVEHFLKKYCEENHKSIKYISREALDLMLQYDWPGNVRELENAIERATVMADDDITVLTPEMLPSYVQSPEEFRIAPPIITLPKATDFDEVVTDLEKKLVMQALQETNWDLNQTAKRLNLSLRSLRYRIKKYDLRKDILSGTGN